MPYRRLPNTDQARIRALKAVVAKGDVCDIYDLAVSLNTLSKARSFRQAKAGRKHLANAKTARLYVSHFIQVLNLAVIRAEIRVQHKEYYGLDSHNNNVPDLLSDASLAKWGKKIIEGENRRISQGGIPIYNPAIAKVRVYYDIFMESYERQKNYQRLTNRSLEALSNMRTEADSLILDIWNQVEAKYGSISPDEKRLDLCRSYGLVYYYRTGEKR